MVNKAGWTPLSKEELSASDTELLDEAARAALDAYAPYSRFKVGAAIALENGKILTGSNFENASYPLSLCAERSALAHAHSRYPETSVQAIAVFVSDARQQMKAVMPCGACRQVMLEWENRQNSPIRVIVPKGKSDAIVFDSVASMLPLAFEGDFLKK